MRRRPWPDRQQQWLAVQAATKDYKKAWHEYQKTGKAPLPVQPLEVVAAPSDAMAVEALPIGAAPGDAMPVEAAHDEAMPLAMEAGELTGPEEPEGPEGLSFLIRTGTIRKQDTIRIRTRN